MLFRSYAPKGIPSDALAWLRNGCARAVEGEAFVGNSAKTLTPMSYADSAAYAREIQRGNREVGELIRKLNITAQ